MGGILLVNKPANCTSHDVVTQIRKLFRTKKVGHAGTLDPFATGLLLLCLDEATRLSEYLLNAEKEYAAELKLGETTDTQDRTGRVLETRTVPDFAEDELIAAIAGFIGEIAQTPPMFSARKVQGRRLYKLARKGKTIERAAQAVNIAALDLLAVELPFLRLRVVCSKGTYIRTLAHDLGAALGCGASLHALERTRIGRFALKDAVSLAQLAQLPTLADRLRLLLPAEAPLMFLPALTLNARDAALFVCGTRIALAAGVVQEGAAEANPAEPQPEYRIYDGAGQLIALARKIRAETPVGPQWLLQPLKVLVPPENA